MLMRSACSRPRDQRLAGTLLGRPRKALAAAGRRDAMPWSRLHVLARWLACVAAHALDNVVAESASSAVIRLAGHVARVSAEREAIHCSQSAVEAEHQLGTVARSLVGRAWRAGTHSAEYLTDAVAFDEAVGEVPAVGLTHLVVGGRLFGGGLHGRAVESRCAQRLYCGARGSLRAARPTRGDQRCEGKDRRQTAARRTGHSHEDYTARHNLSAVRAPPLARHRGGLPWARDSRARVSIAGALFLHSDGADHVRGLPPQLGKHQRPAAMVDLAHDR